MFNTPSKFVVYSKRAYSPMEKVHMSVLKRHRGWTVLCPQVTKCSVPGRVSGFGSHLRRTVVAGFRSRCEAWALRIGFDVQGTGAWGGFNLSLPP